MSLARELADWEGRRAALEWAVVLDRWLLKQDTINNPKDSRWHKD